MKNIIILGANEGIGFFMAKKLLEDGNNVGVLDIHTNNLNELKEQYKKQLYIAECDAKSSSEIETAVAGFVHNYKKIDIAIHNACKCTFDSMEDTSEDVYREVFDINYFGALRLTRCMVQYMKKIGIRVMRMCFVEQTN